VVPGFLYVQVVPLWLKVQPVSAKSQCAPLGIPKETAKADDADGPLFLKLMVPHQPLPSYTFWVTVNEQAVEPLVPQTLGVPPPPQVAGEVQVPHDETMRLTPQLSVPVTLPQFLPSREQNVLFDSGVQVDAQVESVTATLLAALKLCEFVE
jgi:hypothetical protein